MSVAKQTFDLIRNEICGKDFIKEEYDLKKIYILSKKHDLSHLIGDALYRNGMLSDDDISERYKEDMATAVLRYEQQDAVFKIVKDLFDKNNIKFVPLKGAILKDLYEIGWLRTSCDIDILIGEENLGKATEILTQNGFTTDNKKNFHDMHFFYDEIHLELHFNVCENNKQLDGLLSKVWDYTECFKGNEYREIPEYFVFHHIAHMAYHFMSGGCGIRPFIDLWILREKNYCDEDKLLVLISESNLVKFYRSALMLVDIWFNGEEHCDLTRKMSRYVLTGGVYGTSSNSNAIGAAVSKGKRKYLLKIAFPPYKTMTLIYPTLNKHKILLPLCYIHRIFVKLFGKDKERVERRIDNTLSQSEEKINELGNLLKELELHK